MTAAGEVFGAGVQCGCFAGGWGWCVTGVVAATDETATTAAAVVIFTAAPLASSDLIAPTRLPRSRALTRSLHDRCSAGDDSSPWASDRRARKISVSTAACESSSSSPISR